MESAVGAYLVDNEDEFSYRVYYWREKKDEVDFIVARDGDIYAIEVKSGRRGMNSGLPEFRRRFSPAKTFVVGTNGIPLEDFLTCNLDQLLSK